MYKIIDCNHHNAEFINIPTMGEVIRLLNLAFKDFENSNFVVYQGEKNITHDFLFDVESSKWGFSPANNPVFYSPSPVSTKDIREVILQIKEEILKTIEEKLMTLDQFEKFEAQKKEIEKRSETIRLSEASERYYHRGFNL